MRKDLPTANMCHIVYGTKETYKEFAWMFPHIHCVLLDFIKLLKLRLIDVMEEELDQKSTLLPLELFNKFKLS